MSDSVGVLAKMPRHAKSPNLSTNSNANSQYFFFSYLFMCTSGYRGLCRQCSTNGNLHSILVQDCRACASVRVTRVTVCMNCQCGGSATHCRPFPVLQCVMCSAPSFSPGNDARVLSPVALIRGLSGPGFTSSLHGDSPRLIRGVFPTRCPAAALLKVASWHSGLQVPVPFKTFGSCWGSMLCGDQ